MEMSAEAVHISATTKLCACPLLRVRISTTFKTQQNHHHPPPQIYADLPSVVPGLHSVENDCPLSGRSRHKEVESDAAETISDEKSA